jgi:hypothetical protein
MELLGNRLGEPATARYAASILLQQLPHPVVLPVAAELLHRVLDAVLGAVSAAASTGEGPL